MAPKKPRTTTTDTAATRTRVQSSGVTIGRAIEKLTELYAAEEAALSMSPTKIRDDFAKKRAAVLDPLNEQQRKAVEGATNALRTSEDKAAAE
jgi:hypothetical protein